ncbi:hypothetical protein BC835DRAFT_1413916 [Cytidiella melzeri]|nr:hypothetical protein BC835DRAFT_1413916 [Cytidiella melzeri]
MPSTVYEGLLQEVAAVLDVVNELTAAQSSTEIRRKLVQTTNALKHDTLVAREGANNLQGGELSIEDQEDIIDTLEKLKARKKATLNKFSDEMTRAPQAVINSESASVEVDSTASTPAA